VSKVSNFRIPSCNGQVSTPLQSFPSFGGGNVVSVVADPNCNWYATSSTGGFTLTSATAGTGNGSVTYSVGQNNNPLPRTGAINIAGNLIQVIQKGTSTAPPYGDVPLSNAFVDHITLLQNRAITSGCGAESVLSG